jgi:hypothetical protein
MTIPRLNDLGKYWGKFPPVHITAGIFTGLANKSPQGSMEDLATLSEELNHGG